MGTLLRFPMGSTDILTHFTAGSDSIAVLGPSEGGVIVEASSTSGTAVLSVLAIALGEEATPPEGFEFVGTDSHAAYFAREYPSPPAECDESLEGFQIDMDGKFSKLRAWGGDTTWGPSPVKAVARTEARGRVRLEWVAVPDRDLDGYEIRRSTLDRKGRLKPAQIVGTTDAGVNTYVDASAPAEALVYEVCAVDTSGNESRSSTPLGLDGGTPAPEPPSDLEVIKSGGGEVALRWTPSPSEAHTQAVAYVSDGQSPDDPECLHATEIAGDATMFVLRPKTHLPAQLEIEVRAIGVGGCSAPSNRVQVVLGHL